MKAKHKRKLKHIHHVITRRRLVKKRTSHQAARAFFVFMMAISFGTMTYVVAYTKPVVNVQLEASVKPQQFQPVQQLEQPATQLQNPTAPDQAGTASWYAFGLPAPDALTCASRTFARGTYLKVTNLRNGKSVICLVNDYGPAVWTGRVIDLSRGSFRQVEDLGAGTIPVEIRVVSGPTGIDLPLTDLFSYIGYQSCGMSHDQNWCNTNRFNP